MSSAYKFPSGLNNWIGSDKFQRKDFVEDNSILDEHMASMKEMLTEFGNLKERVQDMIDNPPAVPSVVPSGVPTGAIIPYASEIIPEDWLPCNGAEISRETYADLFSTIGVTFGAGDSATTFNVPDMTGRFPLGCDANLGGMGGVSRQGLIAEEMPIHNHGYQHDLGGNLYRIAFADKSGKFSSLKTETEGNGVPHNNMPPYLSLGFIIKT